MTYLGHFVEASKQARRSKAILKGHAPQLGESTNHLSRPGHAPFTNHCSLAPLTVHEDTLTQGDCLCKQVLKGSGASLRSPQLIATGGWTHGKWVGCLGTFALDALVSAT